MDREPFVYSATLFGAKDLGASLRDILRKIHVIAVRLSYRKEKESKGKGPLGCIVLHFFTHAMRLAQTILTVLISRYQNTFQKLYIRIQPERRLFHFNRNNVN